MSDTPRRRHTVRWVAGGVLVILIVVGVVLATRQPQDATQVASPLVGKMAPSISGTDLLTGKKISLASLHGHYVVVNFFASWCVPCQTEMPDLVTFDYQQSHEKGGAIVLGVVFHDLTSSAHAFMRTEGATWLAVPDPGGNIAQAYGVTAPPTTFVIDPSGRITVEPALAPETLKGLNDLLRDARDHRAFSNV
jgi:cytochrome c biogenesis protein CcmG, thiol:disulfide interchange protein DsbE